MGKTIKIKEVWCPFCKTWHSIPTEASHKYGIATCHITHREFVSTPRIRRIVKTKKRRSYKF